MQYIVDIHNTANTASLQNFLQNKIDLSNNFFPGIDKQIGGKISTYYKKAPYMLSANTAWLVPNTTKKPLNDKVFRRALATSININQIVTADYGNIVSKADPTGLLPTWDRWIDKAQSKKLGFTYSTARAKALLAGAGYRDTNGDGFVENKDGSTINLRIIVPNGWSDWMTAIQIIADSTKDAGIRLTPAYPDFNGLVDERNSGKFDLVINNEKQLGNTPYTYYDYLFHLPIADQQTFANFARFTEAGARPWALTLALNKVPTSNVAKAKKIHSQIQKYILEDLPCDPALVQRVVGAVQHERVDQLLERHGHGAADHPGDVERLPQHDGHRRARQVEAEEVGTRRRTADSVGPLHSAAARGRPDPMYRYLARKSLIYLLTFFVAVTIDWAIPRLMPGDPIDGLISRLQADSTASQELHGYFTESFGLDQPLWTQYLNFWRGLLHGDLGPSIAYVGSSVSELILAGAAVHARHPRPRDRAQLHRRQPRRRHGRTAEGARQHRPSRRATSSPRRRTCGSSLVLAYFLAVEARDLPRLGRLRLLAAAGVDAGSSRAASRATGSCRSSRCSSSRSAAGRSGCGT